MLKKYKDVEYTVEAVEGNGTCAEVYKFNGEVFSDIRELEKAIELFILIEKFNSENKKRREIEEEGVVLIV